MHLLLALASFKNFKPIQDESNYRLCSLNMEILEILQA